MIRRFALLTVLILGYATAAAAQAGQPVAITHLGPRTGGVDVTTGLPAIQLGTWTMTQAGTWTVTCTNCTGSGVSQTDSTTFTAASTLFVPIGGFVGSTAVSAGQAGAVQMDTARNLFMNLSEVGGTAADTNSGNKSAGTIRVVLATDQPALTNKLLVTPDANSAVNLGQVAGSTVATAATGIAKVGLTDGTGNAITSTSNALDVNIKGNAVGSRTDTDAATITAGQTNNADVIGLTFGFGGSTWNRITSTSGFLDVDLKSGAVASGAIASGAVASGAIASGAFASGSVSAGAYAVGSIPPAAGTLKKGAVTTAMTGTTSTSVIAGTGSNYLYITQCTTSNASTTVSTDINLQDGSGGTTLYVLPAPAAATATTGGGGGSFSFPTPIKVDTVGNGLFAANVTTGSSTKISCSGFISTVSY